MKKELKIKILVIFVIIIIFLSFFVLKPFLEFKKLEKKVLEAGERYYEINNTQLPTGAKISTLTLKKLYDKDYLDQEIKVKISDKKCDIDNSWVKVLKKEGEYKYYTYLKCGFFKSAVDYKGPEIKLNGDDEITMYKDEEYKELGVSSVKDNVDGNIDVKKVDIDKTAVDTSKVGTYEVTYKIKDSFNNETTKIRTVKVIETLNHIVEKNTNKANIYKGNQYNNYLKLDGILFKIVGINSDKSVKLVTASSISAVNYNDVESWLNDYFYGKLSDSAKKYIKDDSKWCNDTIEDIGKYKKCSSKTKKNPVGLLSVLDYKNSKDDNGNNNISQSSMTYNKKSKDVVYTYQNNVLTEESIDNNNLIAPVINIIEDATVSSGDGSIEDPYTLKGTNKSLKPGDEISNAKTGEYITYSGYKWRVIGKEEDGTTKIIMDSLVENNNEVYNVEFTTTSNEINTSEKKNIGYILLNNVSKYIKTDAFVAKKINYKNYNSKIGYKSESSANKIKLKLNLPSLYDLYSTTLNEEYWFKEYSKNQYCYMFYQGIPKCSEFNYSEIKGIRAVAYLNKNVTIEEGKGLESEPYTIVK